MAELHIPYKGDTRVALFDEVDRLLVESWAWHALCQTRGRDLYYAVTNVRRNGKSTTVSMHRMIMNAPKGLIVDHINGDGLDNRRCNLRICTVAENNRNARKQEHRRFKGAFDDRRRPGRWYGKIKINGEMVHLGVFRTEVEAAMAYDAAALKAFGNFAQLNFPIPGASGDIRWP